MLTVGSRADGRKGLGLGFAGRMEENELEEGEACSGQEGDVLGSEKDLGNLAYIDAKLQDVLGHFQKDFEGEVSAENLGAMFGGYGSFLPMYQRSPAVLGQPRSPPNASSHNGSKSPYVQSIEVARQNYLASTGAPMNKTGGASLAPSLDKSCKKELNISTRNAGESIPKNVSNNVNGNDQKSLKVRIKVGPESVSARDNAAIYSGLGLDISPSSSLEESPYGSEEHSTENPVPNESPMTIIQIMTCFPVHGEFLLSPLPGDLLYLTEKTFCSLNNFKINNKLKKGDNPETRTALLDFTPPARDVKGHLQKKTNSLEQNGKAMDAKKLNCKDDISSILKREIDIETLAGQEIVSDALNIPILSGSRDEGKEGRPFIGEPAKGPKMFDLPLEPDKIPSKGRAYSSETTKDGQLELIEHIDNTEIGALVNETTHSKGKLRSKTSLEEKAPEERHTSNLKDVSSDIQKAGRVRTERNYDVVKGHSDENRGRKDHGIGSAEPVKQNSAQKLDFCDEDGEMMSRGRDKLSESRGKQKKGQLNGIASPKSTKTAPRPLSSAALKEKKNSSHSKGDYSESRSRELKSHNEYGRSLSKESHIDSADIKAEQMMNKTRVIQTKDKLKEGNEATMLAFSEKAKERPGVKKVEDLPMSEEVANASLVAPLTSNAPASDVPAASNAPVVIKENWVGCDRCEKWRLLPYGTDPDLLPKKWQCSMQSWLPPGMNRCSISEEDTTKALNAMYQIPSAPGNTSLHGIHDVTASTEILPDLQPINHAVDASMNSVPAPGKKKHKLKDQSNIGNDPALVQISSSVKKNQQANAKSRSLNDVPPYRLDSDPLSKRDHVNKSMDFPSVKQNQKQKEKHQILGCHSGGGDLVEHAGKHSKSKSKREANRDGFTTSKKIKKEGSHYVGGDWYSDHDGAGNAVSAVDDISLACTSKHNMQKYDGITSSKEVKCDSENNVPASSKRLMIQAHALPNREAKEHGSVSDVDKSKLESSSSKKRKIKDWQEGQHHLENTQSSQHLMDDSDVREALSGNELKREKKVRTSMSELKESSTSNVDGRLEKKGRMTKILLSCSRQHPTYGMENSGVAVKELQADPCNGNTASRQPSDGMESFKKDSAYAQPSVTATSSSSKVSGSHKSRGNLQEVRGSPVESVSSSPFRNSNSEKLFASKRKTRGKDDAFNAGCSVIGSPKNYSDVEVDAGGDLPGTRKYNGSSIQQRTAEGRRALESQALDALRGTFDYVDKEAKAKAGMHLRLFGDAHDDFSPSDDEYRGMENDGMNTSNQHYKCENLGKDLLSDSDKVRNHHPSNGSGQRKSGKSSASRSREKQSSKSSISKNKIQSGSLSEQEDLYSSKNEGNRKVKVQNSSHDWSNYPRDTRDPNCTFQEDREDNSWKRESVVKVPVGSRKDGHTVHGKQGNLEAQGSASVDKQHKDLNARLAPSGASCGKDSIQENAQTASRVDEKNLFDRPEMASGRGKSQTTFSLTERQELQSREPQAVPATVKGRKSEVSATDATNSDALKVIKSKKPDDQNGAHHTGLKQTTPNRPEPRSPGRKDGQSAANVLKEARDLKHTANRLKSEGHELESTGLYFQAALKFLHYASLLEPQNAESARHGEGTQSVQMYSETARLCEFCAREYERCKQMAAAALAYKCVEVAYMKVSYFKHSNASKDRHELQTALPMVLPGESPSSSASDVDNLNNQGVLDKGTAGKGVSSPQVAGNHVIAARHRPNFVRLLNYTNETVCAFEASKKMQIAFAAASAGLGKDAADCLSSVKNVLDFNFHNVERLLQLIRLSMESISS